MYRYALILGLLLAGFSPAQAHDPYEISSVVYVRSNSVELLMEMEFPTGVLLSGQRPSPGLSPTNWFESELPQLADSAGTFFQITAGNHALLPTSTNVTMGVENHIRFKLEFAPTPHRPFRIVAPGIRALSELGPYGVNLTVLDMVNQKVLGQTTLFADSLPVEFPVSAMRDEPAPRIPPSVLTARTGVAVVAIARTDAAVEGAVKPPGSSGRFLALGIFGFVAILLVAAHWFRTRT